mmetsp:Transcript_12670/g.19099  ORF Transcript_12670/g.19099 Transcript_12670/m.19099 type:complete len:111 (+) Transcript_12670:1517-1849(+)
MDAHSPTLLLFCSSVILSVPDSLSEHSTVESISCSMKDKLDDDSSPFKKIRISNEKESEPRYPFFGPQCPRTTKVTALCCLEYLDGPSLYAVSVVNKLWSQAVMDDALWE